MLNHYSFHRNRHKMLREENQYYATHNAVTNSTCILNARTKHASLEKSRTPYSPLTKTRTLRSPTKGGEYTHIWEVKHPIPVATPEVPKTHTFRRETMPMAKSSPTMTCARSPILPERHRDRENTNRDRKPTFTTFKPSAADPYGIPEFRGQSTPGSSHSSQSSPLYFEIDTQRRKATNHYSTWIHLTINWIGTHRARVINLLFCHLCLFLVTAIYNIISQNTPRTWYHFTCDNMKTTNIGQIFNFLVMWCFLDVVIIAWSSYTAVMQYCLSNIMKIKLRINRFTRPAYSSACHLCDGWKYSQWKTAQWNVWLAHGRLAFLACIMIKLTPVWCGADTSVMWCWHQCDVGLTPVWCGADTSVMWGWHQCDVGLTPVWCGADTSVMWGWHQCDVGLTPVWCGADTSVMWGWHQCDVGLTPVWCGADTNVMWGWHQCDVGLTPVWCGADTSVIWGWHQCDVGLTPVWCGAVTSVMWGWHQCDVCPRVAVYLTHIGVCCPRVAVYLAHIGVCCPRVAVYLAHTGVCCPRVAVYLAHTGVCCPRVAVYLAHTGVCCPRVAVYLAHTGVCYPRVAVYS